MNQKRNKCYVPPVANDPVYDQPRSNSGLVVFISCMIVGFLATHGLLALITG